MEILSSAKSGAGGGCRSALHTEGIVQDNVFIEGWGLPLSGVRYARNWYMLQSLRWQIGLQKHSFPPKK